MFSYAEYKNIIILVKQHLPIVDFLEVLGKHQRVGFCTKTLFFGIIKIKKLIS